MNNQDLQKKYDLAYRYFKSLKTTGQLPQDRLLQHQREIATTMLKHVDTHMPFYRRRLDPIRRSDGSYDFSRWNEVPVLTKEYLRTHYDDLRCPVVPPEHGGLIRSESSSSSDHSIRVPSTWLTSLAGTCVSFRHLEAHSVDWSLDLAMIRSFSYLPARRGVADDEAGRWGPPWLPPEERGKRKFLAINNHPKKQIEWLDGLGEVVVNSTPSNIMRLARHIAETATRPPKIAAILTVGECVSEDLREQCRQHLKCDVIDTYATSECGPIATQSANADGYQIQSEIVIAEVIGDDGKPCPAGEPGQLVATPIMNLAMPLIRYCTGDIVCLAKPNSQGETQTLLSTIYGRKKNLLSFGNSTISERDISFEKMNRFLNGNRWQVAQTGKRTIEVRYMKKPKASGIDEDETVAYVKSLAKTPVDVSCIEVEALGVTAGGKYLATINECD